MVKSGADGLAVDMLPLLSGHGDGTALVIPGSSLKGVLRSQAERIVRTVLDIDDRDRWPRAAHRRFPAQLAEVPLVNELFGAPGRPEADGGPAGQGALFVEDTYSRRLEGLSGLNALAMEDDTPRLLRQLAAAGRGDWTVAHHVAIDRWTGGAAEAFLYSVLEPIGEAWEPLELSLDLRRMPEFQRHPAVTLLLLLLRDLVDRRLTLGFAGNRGMGEVEITRIELTGATGLAGLGDAPVELANGHLDALSPAVREELTGAWQRWLQTERARP
jgi:CRISPR/Cas system CSM-associated protein Csm3 (group 7 of RAMP superfamily)